jgi:hypothetical protein
LHGAQGQVSCLAKRRSRAVAMNPLEEAGAARARGTERFKAGDIDGARSDYLRAVAVVCEAGGLRQRQDARELLLPCLSNLAMCCVKTERYREAVEHGASAIALGSACRLAPGIAAKAALRAAQAARAMEDAARARRFLCTARRWARRAHGDVLDAVEKEAVELVVRVRHRVVADRLAALVEALQGGSAALARWLADLRREGQCHPDCPDDNGLCLLLLAVQVPGGGHAVVRVVEALLSSGASPDCQEWEAGRTPLMFACHQGNAAVARLLIDAGADVNAEDDAGFTPLHCTCVDYRGAKHGQILQLLVESSSDVNASTAEGFTPVAYLSQQAWHQGGASTSDVQVLLAAGADPCGPTRCVLGYNAYCFAHKNFGKDSALAEVLREAAARSSAAQDTCAEDARCLEWMDFYNNTVTVAYNDLLVEHGVCSPRGTPRDAFNSNMKRFQLGEEGAYQQEVRACSKMLQFLEATGEVPQGLSAESAQGNPLLALCRAIRPRMPVVLLKLYSQADAGEEDAADDGTGEQMVGRRVWVPSRTELHWLRILSTLEDPPLALNKGFWVSSHWGCVHNALTEPLDHTFAFSVPSDEALAAIGQLARRAESEVLELGAGTGYWAACLRERGVAVRAFDKYPPDKRCANMFFCHSFCDVEEGGSEVLDSWPGGSAKLVLLLVWPFNADEHKKRAAAGATPWDAEAVAKFWQGGGQWVVHAGQLPEGVQAAEFCINTSARCQQLLEQHFACDQRLALPSCGITPDTLTIWKRK